MDVCALVGQNLRRHRLSEGLSQEALADAAGLDRTYVSGLERGIRNPTVKVLDHLASVLSIRIADLVAQDVSQPPKTSTSRR